MAIMVFFSIQVGRYVMVVTAENVVVTFDGHEDVTITVPEEYHSEDDHRLAGLCGNLDYNPKNDMVDYVGISRKTPELFSEVYQDDAAECKEDIKITDIIYNPTGTIDSFIKSSLFFRRYF